MRKQLSVLVGCERSGIVRDAFAALGHDAWSCDIEPAMTPSNRHIIGDIRQVMKSSAWDILFVAHPPCTRLCNSGVRWLTEPPANRQPGYPEDWLTMTREERLEWLWQDLQRGAELFGDCLNAEHIPCRVVENPVMHRHAKARIPNFFQHNDSFQPWHHATDEHGPDNVKKRTLLWRINLPRLARTGTLDGSTARPDVFKTPPGPDRGAIRSMFFPGVARAMAQQYSDHALRIS